MRRKSRALLRIVVLGLLLALRPGAPTVQAQDGGRGIVDSIQAARAAGVPEVALNRVLALGVERRLSSQEVESLLGTLKIARTSNLALEPFVAKIEEGLAKGISPAVIASAMEQKIDDYRFVRALLLHTGSMRDQDSVPGDDLSILVESLSAGLSRQELEAFLKVAPSAPPPMLAIAVDNLALLKQTDLKPELIHRILLDGLRVQGFTPSWRYLARVVVAARTKGISEQQIAEATMRALEEKRDLRYLMATLGFTSRDLRRGPPGGYPARGVP